MNLRQAIRVLENFDDITHHLSLALVTMDETKYDDVRFKRYQKETNDFFMFLCREKETLYEKLEKIEINDDIRGL